MRMAKPSLVMPALLDQHVDAAQSVWPTHTIYTVILLTDICLDRNRFDTMSTAFLCDLLSSASEPR
jgi:hypothetical protein